MSRGYINVSLLSPDISSVRDQLAVGASSTAYAKTASLTMWDAEGIFITMVGARYGTLDTDVQITIQQATMLDATDWEDLTAAISFGTGGTVGSPSDTEVTISIFPTLGELLMPNIRIMIETQAGAGVTFSKIFRTMRGI